MTWPFWFLLTSSNVINYFAQQLLINAVLLSLLTSYPPTRTPVCVTADSDAGKSRLNTGNILREARFLICMTGSFEGKADMPPLRCKKLSGNKVVLVYQLTVNLGAAPARYHFE